MGVIVKNDKQVVQKVQFRTEGKEYGFPVDGSDVELAPFDEAFLQPGEEMEVDGWFKVVDMGLGKADEAVFVGD
jgi:hypothetical protein